MRRTLAEPCVPACSSARLFCWPSTAIEPKRWTHPDDYQDPVDYPIARRVESPPAKQTFKHGSTDRWIHQDSAAHGPSATALSGVVPAAQPGPCPTAVISSAASSSRGCPRWPPFDAPRGQEWSVCGTRTPQVGSAQHTSQPRRPRRGAQRIAVRQAALLELCYIPSAHEPFQLVESATVTVC